jgi:hypothetical protein
MQVTCQMLAFLKQITSVIENVLSFYATTTVIERNLYSYFEKFCEKIQIVVRLDFYLKEI